MIGSTTSSIALLLTEFHERLLRSGACVDGKFNFPIGQRMLAAALSRSAFQVNKVVAPDAFRLLSGLAVANDLAQYVYRAELIVQVAEEPSRSADRAIQ